MCEDEPTRPAVPASTAADPETSPPATAAILPPQHWAQIARTQEFANTDADSTFTDDGSSTESVTSSILEYRTIHGRTYHSEQGNAQYWGSNDEPQKELMDLTHHILTIGLGHKLHLAPLKKDKVQQVIDIGTGTGIWAIDFADEFTGAQVIGTDISPSQPGWVPPNLRFEIEDCTRDWTFASDFADYIHMRWLMGSIKDWNALTFEAFRVCKPGGWVESHEASSTISSDDNTVDPDSAMGQWGKFFIEGSKKIGSSFTIVEDGMQRKAMEAAGFINIQEFDFKNPIGGWSKDPIEKEMGPYTQWGLETDSEGFVLFMAHTLGWSRSEILIYIAHFRREMRSGKHHGYFAQKVVWGQKPEAASE
ncbi:S-adenosyl-L-methionine-dependent methyltransferase [Thelonectria olida]|uniref:S-adenosyl-L-methionine-dependent methyltransferase n=1 Tax=Thelonectria olida TaxID=1576542 RepID=A0A9P8VXI6_9HYPO|nr:S-adenosyl-L-methionine-dependent methyltransferase [Thelonectria olida]